MDTNLSQALLSFTVDIYKNVKLLSGDDGGNIFCSPFSIAAALGMTLAGARSDTAKQIATALHVPEDSSLHGHFSRLQESFKSFAPDIALHVANRMYCQKTFQPLEAYCALLKASYATTIEPVNFVRNADGIRQEINSWVEEATKNKIRGLIPPGVLTSSTVLVLINAVYFKGLWETQFNPLSTHEGTFHETRDRSRKVEMMYQKESFKMSRSDDLKVTALQMEYRGKKTSMVILLPDEVDGLLSLEQGLTSDILSKILSGLTMKSDVEVYLPKFKVELSVDLKSVLRKMGVKNLFSSGADLTGISPAGNVYISDAIHKAFVEVNEEGTEAAAATGMVAVSYCMKFDNVVFRADHPFMFVITAHDPDIVLFVGSLSRPEP